MIENGGVSPEEFKTKKFAQKVLPPRWGNKPPSITATSMLTTMSITANPVF